MIQILSSPVWWSTGVAFLGVILGFRLYIAKIKIKDKAIEDERQQHRSTEDKNI